MELQKKELRDLCKQLQSSVTRLTDNIESVCQDSAGSKADIVKDEQIKDDVEIAYKTLNELVNRTGLTVYV